ncbi:MAG: hypothetical protein RLZZ381_1757 [Cyanobacteriota bacterium]|jgi:uncharacterized membrane protein
MSYKNYQLVFKVTPVFGLIIVILLGFFFRFVNLSDKIFWVDEIATAVRVSGYTISEVTSNLLQQGIVKRDTLLFYQTVTSERTLIHSLNALIKSPEHAPLYFLLTRFWLQWWGNSLAIIRSLSVGFSLLILPSLYWLCQELFNRMQISRLAVGIMSISPFYVAYAQEARPYSLWTVTILLMSASFLRAIRLNNKVAWFLYSFCLIIGYYTSLFSVYVALFQGLYFLFEIKKQQLTSIKNYLISIIIAFLAFTPWIFVIINHLDLLEDNTSWMRGNFNLTEIIAVYIGTNLLIFGDLPLSQNSNPIQIAVALVVIVISLLTLTKFYSRWQNKLLKFSLLLVISSFSLLLTKYIYLDWITIIGALVAIGILSLSAYCLYYLIVQTNRDRWLYIICLMLSLPLPLLITDILNQGQSSTAPRYLIPLQLGILIAVAYTVGSKLNTQQSKFWQLIIIIFILLGIFSNVRNLNLSPFYQKGRNINNPAIAKIINQSSSALVIVESSEAMDAVSLAYSLVPEVKYKVIATEENLTVYLDKFESVFLLKPSKKLQQRLNQEPQIKFQQVYKSHVFSANEYSLTLWSLEGIRN